MTGSSSISSRPLGQPASIEPPKKDDAQPITNTGVSGDTPCPSTVKGFAAKVGSLAATIHNDTVQQWVTKRTSPLSAKEKAELESLSKGTKSPAEAARLQELQKRGTKVTAREMFQQTRTVPFKAQFVSSVPVKAFNGMVFFKTHDEALKYLNAMSSHGLLNDVGAYVIASVAEEMTSQPLGSMIFQIREKNATNLFGAAKHVMQTQGPKGFYRCFTLLATQSSIQNAIAYPLVTIGTKAIQNAYPKQVTDGWACLVKAGLGAGMAICTLPATYPIYRAVTQKRRGDERGAFTIISELHKAGRLWDGVSMSVSRQALANAGAFGFLAIAEEGWKHREEIAEGAKKAKDSVVKGAKKAKETAEEVGEAAKEMIIVVEDVMVESGEQGLGFIGRGVRAISSFGEGIISFFSGRSNTIDGNASGKITEEDDTTPPKVFDTTQPYTDSASSHYFTSRPEPKTKMVDTTCPKTDTTSTQYYPESESVDYDASKYVPSSQPEPVVREPVVHDTTRPETDPASTHYDTASEPVDFDFTSPPKPTDSSTKDSSTETDSSSKKTVVPDSTPTPGYTPYAVSSSINIYSENFST